MQEFFQDIVAQLPEVIQYALLLLCYFFVFLYQCKVQKTGTAITLSMREVLGIFRKGKAELTEGQKEIERRLARCEQALLIMTKDERRVDDEHAADETEGA